MNTAWEKVVGHEKIISDLRTMIRRGKAPHALLFVGEKGIGKRLVAETFAAALLCEKGDALCGQCASCKAVKSASHPDLIVLEPEIRGKSNPAIRIEAVRALEENLSRKAQLGERRVVIIDDADLMNEAAANSLLKTLEEPTGEIVFILIAKSRESLLSTILSRVAPISFGKLKTGEVLKVLHRQGTDEAKAREAAELSLGSVGAAMKILSGGDKTDDALEALHKIDTLYDDELFTLADKWNEGERAALIERFSALNAVLRDMLVLSSGGEIFQKRHAEEFADLLIKYPQTRLFALLKILKKYEKRIKGSNASLKLQTPAFFMEWQMTGTKED